MPSRNEKDDPDEQRRNALKKRRLTRDRTAALVKAIEKFAHQQRRDPKRPTEIRKFVGEVADFLDSVESFRNETANLKSEIAMPKEPRIVAPKPDVAPDILAAYLAATGLFLAGFVKYLSLQEKKKNK